MKQTLFLLFLALAFAGLGLAAPCPLVQPAASLPSGYGCTLGDKLFDSFAFSSAPPTGAQLRIEQYIENELYGIALNGSISSPLTMSYRVTVDQSLCAGCVIDGFSADFTAGAGTGAPTVRVTVNGEQKDVTAGGGAQTFTPNAPVIEVVQELLPNGSTIEDVTNGLTQVPTAVPEPLTMALAGVGLIALALFRRRSA